MDEEEKGMEKSWVEKLNEYKTNSSMGWLKTSSWEK